MKKQIILLLLILLVAALSSTALVGCGKKEEENDAKQAPLYVLNGGFESANLNGWTVEYGDAFSDDCVISKKTFTYSYDNNATKINVNQTGNWYLCGRAYDDSYSGSRTGAIRSSVFTLGGDGTMTMKLAGGALTKSKGENAARKPKEKVCYVGVYLAKDDLMVAYQTNDYFLEHTESYVNSAKYSAGVYNTDNFYEYTINLSEYVGEEMYVRIVDGDDGYDNQYYSYFCVDDIRVNGDDVQNEGEYFVKSKNYSSDAVAENEYQILNGGFEYGSLAGWTVTSGTAFSNSGINSNKDWWLENITYNRDGNYHYGFYNPIATGVMRSSDFILGGSGYVSFKLGGCKNGDLTYIRFMVKGENGDTEVLRVTNYKYWDFQFPYVANGMKLLNLVQYYTDLSAYTGQTMYVEVVDNNSSAEELGCIVLDSVVTYWKDKPVWYTSESFEVKNDKEVELTSPYQVRNGTFETGDLSGWTLTSGEIFGTITDDNNWWDFYPYNKSGRYLFSGIKPVDGQSLEFRKGVLKSENFTVGGSGYMTFKLGGGAETNRCYLSVRDAETNAELYRFGNTEFNDGPLNAVNYTVSLANMVQYKADLSEIMGRDVYIEIVDNASYDWGLLTVDSIITYYAMSPSFGHDAVNIKDAEPPIEYELYNGDFELGSLAGWNIVSGNITSENSISSTDTFWDENIPFNKDGTYFFNGMISEISTGVIRSSEFTLGGLGIVTFKLGGAKNNDLVYLSLKKADGTEVARFSNDNFNDIGFPSLDQGMRIGNMVQFSYQLDSSLLGEKLYFEIVDNATEDWGLITIDSIFTYYTEDPVFSETCFDAINILQP